MKLFHNSRFDFIRWRWHSIALSTLIILAGVFVMATRGVPLGVDFSGGTIVVLDFEKPTTDQQVRAAVEPLPGEESVQSTGPAAEYQVQVRLPLREGVEQGTALSEGAQSVLAAVEKAGLGPFVVRSTDIVGPAIGEDLKQKAIWATLVSLLAIGLYIAFRFRVSFAVGSMIATLHDIFVTFAFLQFFQFELSLNIIAAMLTIVGYSCNDMIVIFDRVRENLRSSRRDALEKVINHSVNQTLTRTVITSGTLFLSVLALYLFGGEVLKGFAFTLLVGTVATTYSGWFIAPSIAIMLSKHQRVATAPQAGALPTAPVKKSGKRARAS